MAELADALDSGSNFRKEVEVQILLPAPSRRTQKERIKLRRVCLFLWKTALFGTIFSFYPFCCSFALLGRDLFLSPVLLFQNRNDCTKRIFAR